MGRVAWGTWCYRLLQTRFSQGDLLRSPGARAEIAPYFRMSSSGHLRPFLNRKVLEIVLRFLCPCSIVKTKPDPNLTAKNPPLQKTEANPQPPDLFLHEPHAELEPPMGRVARGTWCYRLLQTRFSQGDLLASEPKKTESEQAIALQMGVFQRL
jgi:hypothetical protein